MSIPLGKRILLVEDDDALRGSLAEQLGLTDGFATVEAATAAAAREAAAEGGFDAVILDMTLPDGDGRDLCRELRAAGLRCPVIMLTGDPADADSILGRDGGANDYVVKPFRLGVLLARLRAQLLQAPPAEDGPIRIGPYRFHPTAKLLLADGGERKIRLTEKETQILAYLHRACGAVVTREILLGEVWGYNAGVTTHTLETHVYRLRRKIEPDPANATLLLTEGGGYRLGG